MPHVFAAAASGRSKCRGCGQSIKRGELRFGENLPNLFGEGEMTLWFHPLCAAYKRPQSLLEALGVVGEATGPQSAVSQADPSLTGIPDRERLEQAARASLAHRRLPRIDGAERAPSGQATCRHCRERIERDSWRIRILFYEEGRFFPGGFIHVSCREAYFETADVLEQVLHFSPALSEGERDALRAALASE